MLPEVWYSSFPIIAACLEFLTASLNLPYKKVGYVLPPPTPPLLHCSNLIIWKPSRTGDNDHGDNYVKKEEEEDNKDEIEKITFRWEMRACVRLTREIFAQVNIMPSPHFFRLFEDVKWIYKVCLIMIGIILQSRLPNPPVHEDIC